MWTYILTVSSSMTLEPTARLAFQRELKKFYFGGVGGEWNEGESRRSMRQTKWRGF